MAIRLQDIDIIVPIQALRRVYPGGLPACLRDHHARLGREVWHDEHLFRDGAGTPLQAEGIVRRWAGLGLKPNRWVTGERVWNDLCVVELAFGGPTLPCDWLEIEDDMAWLAGTSPGPVVGPVRMQAG